MTIRNVLAVYDSAVQAYGQPMFVPAVGAGIRAFTDEVNRASQDNQLANHPDDFAIWHLADFDDEKGEFVAVDVRCLARGKDVKQS